MKQPLSPKSRRDIAYGMYSRNAIRRFDVDGRIEIIRQRLERTAACEVVGEDTMFEVALALGVRPRTDSMKRSDEA